MKISRRRPAESDRFATPSADQSPAPLAKSPQSTINWPVSSARYVLPNNLQEMIRRLEGQELDRLITVALAEQKRRGKQLPLPAETSRKRQIETVAVTLTRSKINAVRAAFKAGVKPSRIARQFGISQSEVRKALANDPPK